MFWLLFVNYILKEMLKKILGEAMDGLETKVLKIVESPDDLRAAEGRNIWQIVNCVRHELKNDDFNFHEIDQTLHEVGQRIDFLLANERHAGMHEKHRVALTQYIDGV